MCLLLLFVFFFVVFRLTPLSPLSLQAVDSTKLWGVTWTRIDQFLPGFLKDLFPNVTPPPPPPSPPSPSSSQSPPPVEQVDSSTSPDSLPTASSPLPVSQSPARSPDRSPQASPPSSSPGNSALWSVPPSSPQVAQVDMLQDLHQDVPGWGMGWDKGTHLFFLFFLIMTHHYPGCSVKNVTPCSSTASTKVKNSYRRSGNFRR